MKKELNQVISLIAEQFEVSEEEVLQDMREAVNAGRSSEEPEVQAVWAEIPQDGDPVEAVIQYVIERLLNIRPDSR